MAESNQRVYAFARQLRSMAAAKIPGLFPVSPKHPSFSLYVAAGEFARGNEERAWGLLRQKIPEFVEDPMQFDLSFVGWAIDKLRKVRGENDKLLGDARR